MGQLKSAIYARMEEVSFRSGVAVAGGVLAAAGVAVILAAFFLYNQVLHFLRQPYCKALAHRHRTSPR